MTINNNVSRCITSVVLIDLFAIGIIWWQSDLLGFNIYLTWGCITLGCICCCIGAGLPVKQLEIREVTRENSASQPETKKEDIPENREIIIYIDPTDKCA